MFVIADDLKFIGEAWRSTGANRCCYLLTPVPPESQKLHEIHFKSTLNPQHRNTFLLLTTVNSPALPPEPPNLAPATFAMISPPMKFGHSRCRDSFTGVLRSISDLPRSILAKEAVWRYVAFAFQEEFGEHVSFSRQSSYSRTPSNGLRA